jgi:hypothetical protein
MHTGSRSLQGAVLGCFLGLLALFTATGTLGLANYAAVATVLLSLTVIVKLAYGKAHGTRNLPQLVAASDVGLVEGHQRRP